MKRLTWPVGARPSTADSTARASLHGKRAFDAILGTLLLILVAPLMAGIALLVRFDSPGPILYVQERVGYRGATFRLLKFRSMRDKSSDEHHRLASEAWFQGAPALRGYKSANDPRVTRFGRLLRRTSLDELPQLLNVVRGDMSLVGPRPLMPSDRPRYEPWYFERELVPPGMTGLWQVSGRDSLPASSMMALDIEYVRTRSLVLDVEIIIRTLPALLGR